MESAKLAMNLAIVFAFPIALLAATLISEFVVGVRKRRKINREAAKHLNAILKYQKK